MVISGKFKSLDMKSIKQLKIKSGAESIIFVRADQLLNLLKRRLIDPKLELDDFQPLLCESGTIEDEEIEDFGS